MGTADTGNSSAISDSMGQPTQATVPLFLTARDSLSDGTGQPTQATVPLFLTAWAAINMRAEAQETLTL